MSDSEKRAEVTSLGLTYNLLTRYTSFIAVLEEVRNAGADARDVKQPLPLPQGVSNLAVGGGIVSVPEPELYVLAAFAFLMLFVLYLCRRRNSALR
jgi:Ca-activated chloride channel family protein